MDTSLRCPASLVPMLAHGRMQVAGMLVHRCTAGKWYARSVQAAAMGTAVQADHRQSVREAAQLCMLRDAPLCPMGGVAEALHCSVGTALRHEPRQAGRG